MELVILIIVAALFQYIWFSFKVGKGRIKYQVKAPALSGHPVFERLYRVQMNTLEQLAIFIPAILVFTYITEQQGWPGHEVAAGLGVIWIIGRAVYSRSYLQDPGSRAIGFMMTMFPSIAMLITTLLAIILAVV